MSPDGDLVCTCIVSECRIFRDFLRRSGFGYWELFLYFDTAGESEGEADVDEPQTDRSVITM